MIIKRDELYEKLRENCQGKYSIGLHGISISRAEEFHGIDINNPDIISNEVAANIVNTGLKVESARTINGTVQFFSRLDNRAHLEQVFKGLTYYRYGSNKDYVIVATPVELKKEDGTTLFAGATNLDSHYRKYFDTTGSEESTIIDKVILTDNSKIKPQFILGRFKILEDGNIDLEINENHISKKNGIISDEDFAKYTDKLHYSMPFSCMHLYDAFLSGDIKKLKDGIPDLLENPYSGAFLLETLTQLINESNVQNLLPEDQERIKELKAEYAKVQEENKKYNEQYKQYLEFLKSYTLNQMQEFALTKPIYFQDFPYEIRDNVELMRELLKTKGLNPIILCYMGDKVKNDPTAMINLVNNCSEERFDFIEIQRQQPDKSDLAYTTIGLDVRLEPLFWESLNARILEKNQNSGYEIPYFDTKKEIRLAAIEKEKEPPQK